MNLLVATRNVHKLQEIRMILDLPGLVILGVQDFPSLPKVVEDGRTFEANAVKKAMTLALASRHWTLGDDSGLEVTALDGAPGVHSARYAGEPVSYQTNNQKLLRNLDGVPDRQARFVCMLALSSPTGRCQVVEGTCEGVIAGEPRGRHGFGYDPLFIPNGYNQTFAEMGEDLKNRLSHRSRALAAAQTKWGKLLTGEPADWP